MTDVWLEKGVVTEMDYGSNFAFLLNGSSNLGGGADKKLDKLS